MTLTCGVCGSAYTSRTHRDRCEKGKSLVVCRCNPGPHLKDCVEVRQQQDAPS